MRINLRHSLSTRLVLLVVAALVLALPSTALARGVAAPTRASVTPHGKAKPKRGKKRNAPQRILVRPLAKKPSRRPAHPARPAASATPKGHTPTTAAPVAAPPAAAAPIPDTATAEPTVAPQGQTSTTPTVEIPPA